MESGSTNSQKKLNINVNMIVSLIRVYLLNTSSITLRKAKKKTLLIQLFIHLEIRLPLGFKRPWRRFRNPQSDRSQR